MQEIINNTSSVNEGLSSKEVNSCYNNLVKQAEEARKLPIVQQCQSIREELKYYYNPHISIVISIVCARDVELLEYHKETKFITIDSVVIDQIKIALNTGAKILIKLQYNDYDHYQKWRDNLPCVLHKYLRVSNIIFVPIFDASLKYKDRMDY